MGHRKTPTGKKFLGFPVMRLSDEQQRMQKLLSSPAAIEKVKAEMKATQARIKDTQSQLEKLEREQRVKRAEERGRRMRARRG